MIAGSGRGSRNTKVYPIQSPASLGTVTGYRTYLLASCFAIKAGAVVQRKML